MMRQGDRYISGRNIRPIPRGAFDARHFDELNRIGFGMNPGVLEGMMDSRTLARSMSFGMDAIQPTITTGSILTPVQFLQNWLPGFVYVITQARNIDLLAGLMMSGSWEDEQTVQGVLERTGTALPYGDYTNVPFSSFNVNFEYRTVVRFEEGMRVGPEEEARAARVRVDVAAVKRDAAALELEIIRNYTGFYGYNSGLNKTYGYLNDPNLPAYVTVAVGASTSTLWSTKTFTEIQKDILTALAGLRIQSGDVVDPTKVDITLAVATAAVDYMNRTGEFGISVSAWLEKAYPRVRVVSAPELSAANGGANVFYLYADKIDDQSTDDGQVIMQIVQSKFQMLGVQQLAKGYIEDYSNATAGILVKRPWAIVRRSGI